MADMPIPHSHTEFSVLKMGRFAVILGGIRERLKLSDTIQIFDTETNTWQTAGRLPYLMKSKIVAYYDGWIYLVTGQRSKSAIDPTPGQVLNSVWRAKFSL